MEIREKSQVTTKKYCEILIGEVFRHDGSIYMKIDMGSRYDALLLTKGTTTVFSDKVDVIPINGYFQETD